MALGLSAEKEEPAMKLVAGVAVILLTLGLGSLNAWGAWIGSGGNWAYTMSIAGAEMLLLAALGLTILARTWPRRIAGGIITVLLVLACLSNGEKAIHASFKTVFIDDPAVLDTKAKLADEQAIRLEIAAKEYREELRQDRILLRQDIVKAEAEQTLMNTQTQIAEAQTLLKNKGYYIGPIDNKRQSLTEDAMLKYGEEVRIKLNTMKAEDTKIGEILAMGTVVPEANALRESAVKMRGDAENIRIQTWQVRLVLAALEGARSFAVWAFLMVTTATAINMIRNAQDALAMAKANKQVMAINAEIAALSGAVHPMVISAPPPPPALTVQPLPVPPPEPAPAAIPEPVEAVAAPVPVDTQKYRDMAKAAQQAREARKAQADLYIPIPSLVARDADAQAEKVAAQ